MRKNKQNLPHNSQGDRFIPTQVHKDAFQIQTPPRTKDTAFSNYENLLNQNIFKKDSLNIQLNQKIMNFAPRKSTENFVIPATLLKDSQNDKSKITQKRRISRKPYKVLDLPNIQDNFYLNILDWSQSNQISVALENQLYLWSPHSNEAVKVYQTNQGDEICSVAFCGNNTIAIGNLFGQIIFIDLIKKKEFNRQNAHFGRIGSLHWGQNILASGSKDGNVGTWDLRFGNASKYRAHSQEICGLKWSPDGKFIASGGNDNKLVVYSNQKQSEIVKFHEHRAAVKAIGWCPKNPSVLASGGGTQDQCLRFFSLKTFKETFYVDTGTFLAKKGSQICNLTFSRISNEMITTHGYSQNQINLWSSSDGWQNMQGLKKEETLTGHSSRVLYLGESPDGRCVITGAGDEKLMFWNVFDSDHGYEESSLELQRDLR